MLKPLLFLITALKYLFHRVFSLMFQLLDGFETNILLKLLKTNQVRKLKAQSK